MHSEQLKAFKKVFIEVIFLSKCNVHFQIHIEKRNIISNFEKTFLHNY